MSSDFFSKNNFLHTGYDLIFENLSARTQLLDSKKIKIIDLGSHSLTIEVPLKVCSEGHQLQVIFFPKRSIPNFKQILKEAFLPDGFFSMTAKIISIQRFAQEGHQIAVLELTHYSSDQWDEILDFYCEKQEDITRSLLKMRNVS